LGEVYIKDIEEKIKEFKEVTENHIEPEFEVSRTNSFSKIIDENLSGVERYAGLIQKDCL